MKRALTTAMVAMALATAVSPAAAENILDYSRKSLSDPAGKRLWADRADIEAPPGSFAPKVWIARVDVGGGQVLTVTQLWHMGMCSGFKCPLRVYQGDELLAESFVCDKFEDHAISEDGRVLRACGDLVRTNRR